MNEKHLQENFNNTAMLNITDTTTTRKQARIDRPADFLQIDLSWMQQVSIELTDEQLGTALRLIAYCFTHPDTQGVIKEAKAWSTKKWSHAAYDLDKNQLTNDVKDAWYWDGDDLIVDCCPSYVHSLMEHRTKGQMNGKKGAEKRWGAKKENIAPPIDSPIAPPIAEREKGEREGESSKSKEYAESRDSMETVERSCSHSMQHGDKQMKQKLSEKESGRASDSVSCSCSHEPEESSWSSSEQYTDDSMETVEDSASEYESISNIEIERRFIKIIWGKFGYTLTPEGHPLLAYIEKYRDYLPEEKEILRIIGNANRKDAALSQLAAWSEKQKQNTEENLEKDDIPF